MESVNQRDGNVWVRLLKNEERNIALEIIRNGLLDELHSKRLIPSYEFQELNDSLVPQLILRVSNVNSPSPHEWTQQMMCDAALLLLEIEEICERFSFTLVDAHFNNVLFQYGKPVMVDFCSFESRTALKGWRASQEYRTEIHRPITLLSKGHSKFVRFSLEKGSVSRNRLWTLSHPILFRLIRLLNIDRRLSEYSERLASASVFNPLQSLLTLSFGYHGLKVEAVLKEKFKSSNRMRRIAFNGIKITASLIRPILLINVRKEKKLLHKLRTRSNAGYWSNYYGDVKSVQNLKLDSRFEVHLDLIEKLGIQSVTDIGGNDGKFVKALIEKRLVSSGTVLDADEAMVDKGRTDALAKELPISFGLVDISALPTPDRVNQGRFDADLVCAFALIHHLCLRYRMSFAHALSNICSVKSRYLMIEFMPYGMSVTPNEVRVPESYSEKYFVEALSQFVCRFERVVLSETRVLYLCEMN